MELNIVLTCGKSLKQIANNKCPKIDPCGSPIFIERVSDYTSYISTYCHRLLK